MAKKIKLVPISLIAILLFLSIAQAQSYKTRDIFVGSVKSIRIDLKYLDNETAPEGRVRHLSAMRTYEVKGNLTSSEDFYMYGKASYGKDTYTYAPTGKLLEKVHEINGSILKTTYSYNSSGQLLKEIYGLQIKEYIYNLEGRLVEIRRSYGKGVIDSRQVFSYDDKGNLLDRISYDTNGIFRGKETKTYDANGRLLEEVNGYGTNIYNAQGQLTMEIRGKDTSDSSYRKVIYEYDDKGLIVKEEEFDNKGLRKKSVYTYEFDSTGNWTKEITTEWSADGKQGSWETYREISYY
jgi:hypothetical protein